MKEADDREELAASPTTCHIPVIVVTGSELSSELWPATERLRKPCAVEELRTVIQRHLPEAA